MAVERGERGGLVAGAAGGDHGAVVDLAHVAIGGEVEAEIPISGDEVLLGEREQARQAGGGIERHVKASVELAHPRNVVFAVDLGDDLIRAVEIGRGQVRQRVAKRLRLQPAADGEIVERIGERDLDDDGAAMRLEINKPLRFQLAERLADRHAADIEAASEILLAQRRSRRQRAGEDRLLERRRDIFRRRPEPAPARLDHIAE